MVLTNRLSERIAHPVLVGNRVLCQKLRRAADGVPRMVLRRRAWDNYRPRRHESHAAVGHRGIDRCDRSILRWTCEYLAVPSHRKCPDCGVATCVGQRESFRDICLRHYSGGDVAHILPSSYFQLDRGSWDRLHGSRRDTYCLITVGRAMSMAGSLLRARPI